MLLHKILIQGWVGPGTCLEKTGRQADSEEGRQAGRQGLKTGRQAWAGWREMEDNI